MSSFFVSRCNPSEVRQGEPTMCQTTKTVTVWNLKYIDFIFNETKNQDRKGSYGTVIQDNEISVS